MSIPLSQLPFDLISTIITAAARLDEQTAMALTLVSKETQDIADRILFNNIYFRERNNSDFLDRIFLSQSPRLIRARLYITSVRAPKYDKIKGDTLKTILNHGINLRTLVAGDLSNAAFSIQTPPNLTTLGVPNEFALRFFWPQDSSDTENHPLFSGITHLVVEDSYKAVRVHMSNLTHVFVGCRPASRPPWTHPLPPNLQLYLVYLPSYCFTMGVDFSPILSQSQFADIQYQKRVDKRFVLVVPRANVMWPGRETCGGFVVAPDWNGGRLVPESSRTNLYDWVGKAWTEGEKIVEKRVDW
ncbi:hypothetical protein DL96DRAFT_1685272 [Flagelloscypha sp. PMI_526]|nr:hypothetical protein DL96DRAFT_1685272 [Flagelloscypha sp. PMI_526]